MLVFWTVFLIALPLVIAAFELRWRLAVELPAAGTVAIGAVGAALLVRNPMAVAGIAQGVAVGLMLSSWFGAEFERYRSAVGCWVPRAGRTAPTQSAAQE